MTKPCYNRADFKKTMLVQDGYKKVTVAPAYGVAVAITVPNMVEIQVRNSTDCCYTLSKEGQADSDCVGCSRRKKVE